MSGRGGVGSLRGWLKPDEAAARSAPAAEARRAGRRQRCGRLARSRGRGRRGKRARRRAMAGWSEMRAHERSLGQGTRRTGLWGERAGSASNEDGGAGGAACRGGEKRRGHRRWAVELMARTMRGDTGCVTSRGAAEATRHGTRSPRYNGTSQTGTDHERKSGTSQATDLRECGQPP